jgi:antitoxin component YwqK of YwqJK toxin-antitoxin module
MGEMGAPEKITIRDAEGAVTEEATMVKGVLEGETLVYAEGHLRARLQYRNGKQHGEALYYDASGHVQSKAQYAQGRRQGEALFFGPNGQLLRKATYDRGLLHGHAIDYHPSGKPRQVSTYKEDVLDGEAIRLAEDGTITERMYYERGRLRPAPRTARLAAPAKTVVKL